MSLLEHALDDANLFAAWEKVRRNRGAAGSDGQTIEQFSVNAFGRLLTLKQQVTRNEYTPAPLLEVHIPKPSGDRRRLLIPTVRDRILQTAWVQVLADEIERELEEPSFAYRVGRSVSMAVARVAWFRAVAALLPERWRFPGRRRRPPRDPFNALLSYGYGVLFHTVHTLLIRRGLDPWLGHLHVADGRHPALVSDLMEEFRPLVVDSVALHALFNQFAPDDFEHSGDPEAPCRLRDEARKKYLQWLQNRLRSLVLDPHSGKRVDYHRLIQAQVCHYADVVLGREKCYRPYKAR